MVQNMSYISLNIRTQVNRNDPLLWTYLDFISMLNILQFPNVNGISQCRLEINYSTKVFEGGLQKYKYLKPTMLFSLMKRSTVMSSVIC